MKLSHMSDLHLDFHVPFHKNQSKWRKNTKSFIQQLIQTDNSEHEVMVIAGDLSHFNTQSYWALEEFSYAYEQVFFCFGNHDFYLVSRNQEQKYKGHSLNRMNELLQLVSSLENVTPLIGFEKHQITKEISIAGDTFWYPIETDDQIVYFYEISNDSQLIKRLNVGLEYNYSMSNYNNLDESTIIVTHVPPITTPSHRIHNSTACYLTPITELKATHWIYGHVHEQCEIIKPYGNFYSNTLGYEHDWMLHIIPKEAAVMGDLSILKNRWNSIKYFEV